MPRQPRIVLPGAWYHVTARGMERREIFRDDTDRRHFLEILAETADRFRLRIFAYVLMDNHYHLLLQLSDANLSRACQWLNLSYGVWFNRRHQRSGYLFQGRFKATLVEPASWGLALSAYIHLNPVRLKSLGLSKSDTRRARVSRIEKPDPALISARLRALRNFRWSSCRAYLRPQSAPHWLDTRAVLELAGGHPAERPMRYSKYIEDQLRQGVPADPVEQALRGAILGTQAFLDKTLSSARKALTGKSQTPAPAWTRQYVPFADLLSALEEVRGERWADFKDRHADAGRDLLLVLGRRHTNLTLAALATAVDLKGPAQASMAINRGHARLKSDKALATFIGKVEKLLPS